MENTPFIDDYPIKTSFELGDFPLQRILPYHVWLPEGSLYPYQGKRVQYETILPKDLELAETWNFLTKCQFVLYVRS